MEGGRCDNMEKKGLTDKLIELNQSENVAEDLDDDELREIGKRVCEEFDIDEKSREEWLKKNDEAIKIAKQVMEAKTFPWDGASNVKYPLITSAVIAFNSRTYPEIVKPDKVVHVGIIGPDLDGQKELLAKRLSDHMTYQLLIESQNWETDTDKLLMVLPLLGLVYRKSYFDPIEKMPATDLCLPDRITVNEKTKSIEKARRVTHQLELTKNDIIERIRLGIYLDIDLEGLEDDGIEEKDKTYELIEQHRYLDLDDDGYEEPYIVTAHYRSQKVFRIKSRFELEDIIYNEAGELVKIPATCYFTDYHFLRNPDGGFHSMGFGTLLYPINETVNTLINNLIDAGTIANLGGGFIAEGARIKKGMLQFKPGEWKFIPVPTGSTMQQMMMPLPVREPSPVLLNLMNVMLGAGKELANTTDILQGQQPAQNAPATTVLALLEQGLKDQKAILKRLYRSFMKEFQKLAWLNKTYMDDETYFMLFTGEGSVTRDDYANKKLLVFPAADPNMSSDAQRLARSEALMQMYQLPEINKREILVRRLNDLQVPNPEKLLLPPPKPTDPPPPDAAKTIAETKLIEAKIQDVEDKRNADFVRLQQMENMYQAQAAESAARVQKMHDDMVMQLGALIAKFAEIEVKFGQNAINVAEKEADEVAVQSHVLNSGQETFPPEQQVNYTPADLAVLAPPPPIQPPLPPENIPPPPGMMPENNIQPGENNL